MSVTTLLLFTVGIIAGSGIGYAFLSSRAFDQKHPMPAGTKTPEPVQS